MEPYVFAIRGPMNSAKSTFPLTTPGMKRIYDLELGVKRAIWRFPADSYAIWRIKPDITWLTYSRGDRVVGQKEKWGQLTEQYVKDLSDSTILSIVFDTAKEAWTMDHQSQLQEKQDLQLRQAMSNVLKQNPHLANDPQALEQQAMQLLSLSGWRQSLLPIEYAQPNSRMDNLIALSRAEGFEKNLFLINHERPIYIPSGRMIDGKPEMIDSQQKELDGYKNTLDLADWSIVMSREVTGDRTFFRARIEKSPLGVGLIGKTIDDPTYAKLETLADAISKQEVMFTNGTGVDNA